MNISGLTDATLRANASSESYERGEAYFSEGAVLSLKRKDDQWVEAFVKGGQTLPYTVRVRHDDAGIAEVHCTCPYYAGSWCKHVVATLLACLQQPGAAYPSAAALLDGLDRAALVSLFERLIEHDPDLADWIEQEAARLR